MNQHRALRAFRAFCFLAVALGVAARGAVAAFPAGTPSTPYLTGQNYWYYPPDSAYATIMQSGVSLIRIGGHTFDVTPMADSDLLKQVDNIRSIGAEPIIQVSRFAGVAAAVDALNYINVVNGRHVKFWSIGNEPDLGWTGTDADLAAQVAGYITQIAPALRDVDPSICIIAPEFSFYSTSRYSALLGGASDISGTDAKGRYYIDCVSFHRYPFGSTLTRDGVLTEMHTNFEGRVNALLSLIASANALHGRTGSSALTWALTEFNMTYSNPTSGNTPAGLGVASFLNGQYFAEYYRVGLKYGVSLMNTWSMLEGGGNGSGGDLGYLGGNWAAPVPRSSYYHMQMVADYMVPGGYIPSTSNSANLAVWATSSSNQSLLSVMVLNENTTGNQTFTVRLNDEPVQGPGVALNVSAGLAQEFSATIGNQTTAILMFDATGALVQRVTYSLTRNLANQPPLVETFTPIASTPAAPTDLTAASGDTQVTLTWSAVPGATTYNIKRATVSGGPYTTIVAGAMSPGYTDTGLTNGTSYVYVVSALNDHGDSADSAEAAATPLSAPPSYAFEAESLTFTASGATTSLNSDSGASGGKWIQLNSSAAGPYIEFTTGTVPAGTYTLQLTYKANNNRGQLSFAVDGAVIPTGVDEYASAVAFVSKPVATVIFNSAGAHKLRLTTTGKNASSTGYLLSADKFTFGGPAAATIALSGLSQTYDGTPKSVSTTTSPAGIAVTVTYNGTSAAPTDAGQYRVVAAINSPTYYGTVGATLTIAKATATVSFTNLAQVYDGTVKAPTTVTSPPNLPVSIVYDAGTTAMPINAGHYAVLATVADPNYQGVASDTLVVAPAAASVTLGNLTQAYDGAPKPVTVTTAPMGLAVGVTYDGAVNAPTAVGHYAVTATVLDPNYVGAATGTLVIADMDPPVLTLPPNLTVEATGPAGAAVSFTASATDNVDGTDPVVLTPPSGSVFPLGVTTVAATANDAAGNTATGEFTVTVVDTTPPAITVPTAVDVDADTVLGATVTFVASATDLVSGPLPVTFSVAPGSVFPIGATTVEVSATDAAGNSATASFVVTVRAPAAAVITHVPTLNGVVEGSLQVLTAENGSLNSNSLITGELLLPGTPTVVRNGNASLGDVADATGSATPAGYTLTLNGNAAVHRLVRRFDPTPLSSVAAPAEPSGTRSVALNRASDTVASWAEVRDLTVNGTVGAIAVPPGVYGSFTANAGNTLVLGVVGATVPAVYQLQNLVLNGGSRLQVVGPVIVIVGSGAAVNGALGNSDHPEWLDLRFAHGGLTLNGGSTAQAFVAAPTGSVALNGASVLFGGVEADSLVVGGNARLHLLRR